MSDHFSFDNPARFIIGTVGVPGERQFFLQVSDEKTLATFALEKSQAAALAERANELLREIKAHVGEAHLDNAPLSTPIESEFTIGVMSLTWQPDRGTILFEAREFEESVSEVDDEVSFATSDRTLTVALTVEHLRGFIRRTQSVVAAGRQPCIFCGGPLNPGGHLCPRANGYRRQVQ